MVRARRSQRGSRNAGAQPASVPEDSILETQDSLCEMDAVGGTDIKSTVPLKGGSMESLLLSVPSPARSRKLTSKCPGEGNVGGQSGTAGVRAGPEPWNQGVSSQVVAATSLGYREQLRANGHKALERLWHRGIAPKSPSSMTMDLTPTPTFGHNLNSAGDVLASLALMPPASGYGSPSAGGERRSQFGGGSPLNLADICPMPAAGPPPSPSTDALSWSCRTEVPQWSTSPLTPLTVAAPMPPMSRISPMPVMMAQPAATPLQQPPQPCGGTLQSNLLSILMPGAGSLDTEQIASQLKAAAQCQYDD